MHNYVIFGSSFRHSILLSVLLLGTRVALPVAIDPCEHRDGSGSAQLELSFAESYGSETHLPALGQQASLSQIYGSVRPVNDTAAKSGRTVVLRLWETAGQNRFWNGSNFSALGVYFDLTVGSGVGYVRLKRGIDREIMDNRLPNVTGVTTHSDALIKFFAECTPDDASYALRNFSVHVLVTDLNDNAPEFYNASTNTKQRNLTATVRTETPKDVLVFSGPVARDMDEGGNAATRVSALPHPYFKTIDSSRGSEMRIYTKRRLYRDLLDEAGEKFRVLVIAVDSPANASLRLTTTATIDFTIIQDEEAPPVFVVPNCLTRRSLCLNPTYFASVVLGHNATSPLSTQPGPILAVNRGTQSSNSIVIIRYALVAGHRVSSFRINESTGLVIPVGPINERAVLAVEASKWSRDSSSGELAFGGSSVALVIVSAIQPNGTNTTDSGDTTQAPSTSGLFDETLHWSIVAVLLVAVAALLAALASECRKRRTKPEIEQRTPAIDNEEQGQHSQCKNSPEERRSLASSDEHEEASLNSQPSNSKDGQISNGNIVYSYDNRKLLYENSIGADDVQQTGDSEDAV